MACQWLPGIWPLAGCGKNQVWFKPGQQQEQQSANNSTCKSLTLNGAADVQQWEARKSYACNLIAACQQLCQEVFIDVASWSGQKAAFNNNI
jgi:hypothetical protein